VVAQEGISNKPNIATAIMKMMWFVFRLFFI
jgi:hypothetical protein